MKNPPLHELLEARLTERQMTTLNNGLAVAADRFDEDAKQCRVWGQPENVRRLGNEFERQATETRSLIALLCTGEDDDAAVTL